MSIVLTSGAWGHTVTLVQPPRMAQNAGAGGHSHNQDQGFTFSNHQLELWKEVRCIFILMTAPGHVIEPSDVCFGHGAPANIVLEAGGELNCGVSLCCAGSRHWFGTRQEAW